ncbi:iron complex outermembrane recepter protein [Pseudomonas sp. LAMO17WK12:I10]|uniref:TonB-dependent receptor plug domain-containing protein n=1 Tax=unclassified Pseudomonas TaxID=196821 RepID=UPI000BC7345E|nr:MULTISPECIES: TonB-dependent receptor [unclassified Pseudomonas]PXX64432.1 iron complex outermembrane receptor protein [Pseudomonas sp. LAMO17WK12:I9]SNY39215.1 iron complex outermembrane recepter protein [Pseudomonas sp. LAMO17WK12:I10]
MISSSATGVRQPHRTFAHSLLFIALCEALTYGSAALAADSDNPLDTVVVIGNRGQARTLAESPSPVDVISSKQLLATGQGDLTRALSRVLPSLNQPASSGFGSTSVVRPISLRGLNGDQVLVLVNGKRRHNSALLNNGTFLNSGSQPVDLDMIPTALVDHVEVLRDGASAQYGSDAIGGVVNIVLKQTDHGGSLSTSYGQNYENGDGETARQTGNVGLALPNDGFINLALDVKKQRVSDRSDDAPYTDSAGNTSSRHTYYGTGLPESRNFSLGYNAELPVNDALSLYSFSTYTRRNSEKPLAFHQPASFDGIATPFPEGIEDTLRFIENDFQVAFGGKGKFADWDYDLSSTYGQDHAEATLRHTYNLSYGQDSPTSVDTGVKTFSQWTNNLDLTRAFDFGLAKPTQISWGLEQRYENYKIGKGDYASYASGPYTTGASGNPIAPGTISGAGTTPADAAQRGRTSLAGYGEIGQDLTDKWHVDLAGRYEHYNDGSGTTTNGKLSTRYQLTPTLAVRGTYSTGFRAPSLAQQIYSSTSQSNVNGNLIDYRNVAVDSDVAKALGASTLKPEKSTNISVGLTFQPSDASSVTLDAYQIKIRDRIAQTGYLGGTPQIAAILAAAGLNTNQSVTYFTNALDTTTRGIDLVGDYRQNLGAYGGLRYTLGFNWNTTQIDDIHASPVAQQALGPTGGYDRQRQGNLKHGLPESKLLLGTTWTIDKFEIGLNLTRYGEYTQYGTTENFDRTFSPAWITDLNLDYHLNAALTLNAGANNLFNKYPERTGLPSSSGAFPYGNFSPYGTTGGYWYTGLTYNF